MGRLAFTLLLFLTFGAGANTLPPDTSKLTPEQARRAFNVVARDGVPHDILEDFCKTRAFFGAQALLDHRIRAAQIEASGDDLGIYSDHSLSGKKFISWTNHTALVIQIKTGQREPVLAVIDPSLFDKVVSVNAWLARISAKPSAKVTEIVFFGPKTYTGSASPTEQLARLLKYEVELSSGRAPLAIADEMNQDELDQLLGKVKNE